MRSACATKIALASSSITGPTSVDSKPGSPTVSSSILPANSSNVRSAISLCTNKIRAAEQRCPAESKAAITASLTNCSGNADESAIKAFCPPVSAIKVASGALRAASARLIAHAVSVEPVNTTPVTRGSRVNAAPTVAPSPGVNCKTFSGMPAWCKSLTAKYATKVVCSAGLAITVLPAASAAVIWPRKIASGKFHGLMHTNTPRPCNCSSLDSPVGPGSFSGAPKCLRACVA